MRRRRINESFDFGVSSNENECSFDVIFEGWDYYFPNEEFNDRSQNTVRIQIVLEFYYRNLDKINCSKKGGFDLDFRLLTNDILIIEKWPNISEDILEKPRQSLAILSMAMYQVVIEKANGRDCNRSKDKSIDLSLEENEILPQHPHDPSINRSPRNVNEMNKKSHPYVHARITNLGEITRFKNMRTAFVGKLISIKGTVVKVSSKKHACTVLTFRCESCGGVTPHYQTKRKYTRPTQCNLQTEDEILPCGGNSFEPIRSSLRNIMVEYQIIRLQEEINNKDEEVGRVPRYVDCELIHDLVGSCSPGQIAIVTGIIETLEIKEKDKKRKDNTSNVFNFYMEGVSVRNQQKSSKSEDENLWIETANAHDGYTFSKNDCIVIKKINSEPDLFGFLVTSVCPSIFGNLLIKAGILLGLLGGSSKKTNINQSQSEFLNESLIKRSSIHILIVGDPGLGKSQLLQYGSNIAPRGVYVCGNSSTTSGLTVTISKDSNADGNEFCLEAGALVLSDQGICCIDEFDKMGDQHQALLEAMEQQSVSIAKAGIVCSLLSRTSILAAGNPIEGHYNKRMSVSENLKLKNALLSRFDLIFIMLDTPDEVRDKETVDHIMDRQKGSRKRMRNETSTPIRNARETSNPQLDTTLISRLTEYDKNQNKDPLPEKLFKKYIAYARQNVNPKLNEEAKKYIKRFYLNLRARNRDSADHSVAITPRQLESLIRLSQARAKIELRNVATINDAKDAIEIFSECFREMLVIDSAETFNISKKKSNEVETFYKFLQDHERKNQKGSYHLKELRILANMCGVGKKGNVEKIINILNLRGSILSCGNSSYTIKFI